MAGKRPTKWTAKNTEAFLKAIASGATVTDAAAAAGMARTSPYERKYNDPEFAAAWAEADEAGTDVLEREATRRALGFMRPIFNKDGDQVGEELVYSDTLLIFKLKGHRPEKYRERWSIDQKTEVTVNHRILWDEAFDAVKGGDPAEIAKAYDAAVRAPVHDDKVLKLVDDST